MSIKPIPLALPDITAHERRAVLAVMRTPYVTRGPKLVEFEKKFASYVGARHAVAVNSGTSALHLAVRALGIGKGDYVITTPLSFIASSNCLLFEHAVPIFADVDPATYLIDPEKVEEKVQKLKRQKKSVKAILAVDLFGYIADWERLRAIAKRYHLFLIEDSCQALGTHIRKNSGSLKAGTFGDISVFSFYPNKPITTGEGGAVVTNNAHLAGIIRSMRNQGIPTQKSWNTYEHLGYNYHMSDINCAVGIAQLRRIEEIIKKRSRVAARYTARLCHESSLHLLPLPPENMRLSYFVYLVRLADSYSANDRERIIAALAKKGIAARDYLPAIHLLPFYRKMFGYKHGDFPYAEHIADRTIALPFFSTMTHAQIDYVCAAFLDILKVIR